jgi:hypothetical protein
MRPYSYIILAILAIVLGTNYQNCGSSNQIDGAMSTSASSSNSLVVTNINLGQGTYSAGASMTGTATITNANDPIICQWAIMVGQSLVNAFTSESSQSICSIPSTTLAPNTPGAYSLILTAIKGSIQGSTSIGFSVQGEVPPGPTPTATPPGSTPTPTPSGPTPTPTATPSGPTPTPTPPRPTPTPSPTPVPTPPQPTPEPTPLTNPGYYCTCYISGNSGPPNVCNPTNLTNQQCGQYTSQTWNCTPCPTNCSLDPFSCF